MLDIRVMNCYYNSTNKPKGKKGYRMKELTAQELNVVTLALTGQLMQQKEKIAEKNFTDEYTLKVVKELRKLQSVYEKVLAIERAVRTEQDN